MLKRLRLDTRFGHEQAFVTLTSRLRVDVAIASDIAIVAFLIVVRASRVAVASVGLARVGISVALHRGFLWGARTTCMSLLIFGRGGLVLSVVPFALKKSRTKKKHCKLNLTHFALCVFHPMSRISRQSACVWKKCFLLMYTRRIMQHKMNQKSSLQAIAAARDNKHFKLVHFTARSWKHLEEAPCRKLSPKRLRTHCRTSRAWTTCAPTCCQSSPHVL